MADYIFADDDSELVPDEAYEEGQPTVRSYIAPDVEMEGNLSLKQGIEVGGVFNGTIRSNNLVKIVEGGFVEGNVDAFHVVIDGGAHLSLVARKRLEINKGGLFVGNLEIQPEFIVLSEFATFGENEEAAREFRREFTRFRSSGEPAAESDAPPPGGTS